MNVEEKKKVRSQAKGRFTRISNNLKKAVEDNLILKTVESRYKEFKDAWKEVQHKHDEYMGEINEDSDAEEEWINNLNTIFCEVEERTDAYIEKKMKQAESERKFASEQQYTEELKLQKIIQYQKFHIFRDLYDTKF